jgi:WD40 repeat protein
MKKLLLLLLLALPLFAIAQEGVYHIKFTSDGVYYSVGVLVDEDFTEGYMRVRYDAGKGQKIVQMKVSIKNTEDGFTFYGSDPVDTDTGKSMNYSPDNFYVTTGNDDNHLYCKNIDDQGTTTPCCIMEVTGELNQNIFLYEFGWDFFD